MGKAFATKNVITIKDDEGNFINIREKLPFGSRNRLMGTLAQGMSQDSSGKTDLIMDYGRYQSVLLEEGIVEWGGEAFLDEETGKIKPVNPTNIAALDPDWPLLDQVISELGKRNQIANKGASPNGLSTSSSSASNGSGSLKASSAATPLESTTST